MTDQEDRQRQFAETMAKMRRAYLASLTERADKLARLLDSCRAGDERAEAEVAQAIHSMAGTAGSFGLLDVSEHAAALDGKLHAGVSLVELGGEIEAFIEVLRARSPARGE